MEFHPIANMFPLMGDGELDELSDSIAANGLHQPIVMYEGKILDGRNRYRAWCDFVGEEVTREQFSQLRIYPSGDPGVTEYEGDDPLSYVLSLNLHRRHLTASQRAALATEIANLDLGGDRKSDQTAKLRFDISQSKAAEKLDVSERYVNEAKKIQRESPEHFDKVKSGELSLQQAKRDMVITIGDVEIRTEADVDRAANQIPFVRNVKQWHSFCDQVGKSVRVMNEVIQRCGFEDLLETLRQEDLLFECNQVQKWCGVISDKMDEMKGEV